MGGHGGLNILPQKRWNVYNFDNREKVRLDEEAAAKEEQLKREQSRKRDTELRVLKLRQLRGLSNPDPPESQSDPDPVQESRIQNQEPRIKNQEFKNQEFENQELKDQESRNRNQESIIQESRNKNQESRIQESIIKKQELEDQESRNKNQESEDGSKHMNLFAGIKIFDPKQGGIDIEAKIERASKKGRKEKKEEVKVVSAEDEKYRLGYGLVGKGSKLPWYLAKKGDGKLGKGSGSDDDDEREVVRKSSGKKSLQELREERLKREKKEKEREKALFVEKSRTSSGFQSRR